MSQGRDSADMTAAGFDDAELLRRCCEGSAPAWDEFARRYMGVITHAVRQTLLRTYQRALAQDVENVVQDVFASLYEDSGRRLGSFSGRCTVQNWLRAVAIRRALNYVRSERRRQGRSLDEHPLFLPEAIPEETEEVWAQRIRQLEQHLSELAPRDRLVLRLFYLDGVRQKQIARILEVSENTIGPILARARQRLQKKMRPS